MGATAEIPKLFSKYVYFCSSFHSAETNSSFQLTLLMLLKVFCFPFCLQKHSVCSEYVSYQ